VSVVIPVSIGAYNLINHIIYGKESKSTIAIFNDRIKIYSDDLDKLESYYEKVRYVNDVIEDDILENLANKLHVFPSNAEIEEAYSKKVSEAKKRVGESLANKDVVRRVYGITVSKLRDLLYKDLRVKMVTEIIKKSGDNINHYLDKEKLSLALNTSDTSLKRYFPKKLFSLGKSIEIYNYEFANSIHEWKRYPAFLQQLGVSNDTTSIMKYLFGSLKSRMILADLAIREGIVSDLFGEAKIIDLNRKYKEKLESNINPKDYELRSYYKSNIDFYKERERAYVDIVFLPYKPSNEDIEKSNIEAKALLDIAIKSNKLPEGFEIKSISKANFSKLYGKKYFRRDEIVPSLIDNINNKVIAKESNGNIEYIEISPKISDESISNIENLANRIKKDISLGKITIKKAVESYSDANFKKQMTVYRDTNIDKDLIESILKNEELSILKNKKGIYIFKRDKYFKDKTPSLDEIKDRVERDYKKHYLDKEISSLLNSKKDIEIEINDEYIRELLIY
jgi:hypothetical protein